MEYADVVWDGCTEYECDLREHVRYETAKIVTGAIKGTSYSIALRLNLFGKKWGREGLFIEWYFLTRL